MRRSTAVWAALTSLCVAATAAWTTAGIEPVSAAAQAGGSLVDGVAASGQVTWNTTEQWTFTVPAGTGTLTVALDGGGARVDLLGRAGSPPTAWAYDVRGDTGNGPATVRVPSPRAGTWYLEVSGRRLFEPHGYTITASTGATPQPSPSPTGSQKPTPTASPTAGPSPSPTPTTSPSTQVVVDRNCADGAFVLDTEDFRTPGQFAGIQDLVDAYTPANYMTFIDGVLARRYPTGKRIIDLAGGKPAVDRWLWRKDTAADVLGQLGLVVHEVGHGIDRSTPDNRYFVTRSRAGTDIALTAPGMHGRGSTSSSPMYSMSRSLLLADTENRKRPPAERGTITTSREFGPGTHGSDTFLAETYLNGDPANTSFESGDQGFNMLVEEWNQYVNSMAVAYYLNPGGTVRTSDRHALLTQLWWIERYLAKIRAEFPDQYTYLTSKAEWRGVLLSLWGRSWRYLTTDLPGQAPDSAQLTELVRQAPLLAEIQRLRTAHGCGTPTELFP
ncbi:PPC domain-containing protein [Longispora urticae]